MEQAIAKQNSNVNFARMACAICELRLAKLSSVGAPQMRAWNWHAIEWPHTRA